MHAQRHRAIYTLKKLQDIESALTIVDNALRSLEKLSTELFMISTLKKLNFYE